MPRNFGIGSAQYRDKDWFFQRSLDRSDGIPLERSPRIGSGFRFYYLIVAVVFFGIGAWLGILAKG